MNTAWIYLLLSTFCNSVGSMLVKVASMGNYNSKLGMYISWPFIIAVILFGTNLIFYAQAIRKIPLYVAYPFVVGITIIFLTLFSTLYYSNKIQFYDYAGVIFILVGITLLSK